MIKRYKKEIMVIFICLILVITFDKMINYIGDKYSKIFVNSIDQIETLVEENNIDEAINKSEYVNKLWKDKEEFLSLFYEHKELESISILFVKLDSNIKNNEYEVAIENLNEVKYWLELFTNKNKLKFKNIF